ncbi:hypothetical protein CDAR_550851 [Caerostris darwini]|uniref:Uncharacterized protein n=1 Tax=Caerostris darwini TaxID=1538125 RepID=A0AAV4QLN3_9ARAC|nr:hypothetical protein CDAR_550851 [Caerostris darwini]
MICFHFIQRYPKYQFNNIPKYFGNTIELNNQYVSHPTKGFGLTIEHSFDTPLSLRPTFVASNVAWLDNTEGILDEADAVRIRHRRFSKKKAGSLPIKTRWCSLPSRTPQQKCS